MLSHVLFTLALARAIAAQDWTHDRPNPPPNQNPTDTNQLRLNGKRFPYDQIPYMADTASTIRGVQTGFNQCNASTAGPTSECQTIIVNSISDFCIFIPPTLNAIGNAEGETVAACTDAASNYHGARPIPAGALTAVQFLKTPSYVGIAARINQTMLNLPVGDGGGELDSGGQDARGNPIGGLAYSNNLPGHEGQMTQSVAWTLFIGGDIFCMKLCSPTAPNAANLCEHIYDTVGCNPNFPAAYTPNVFESCAADDMHPPGELVAHNTIILHSSSSCTPYQSASLYAGGGGSTTTSGTTGPTTTGTTTTGGATHTSKPDAALPRANNVVGLAALLPVVAGLVGAYLV